MTTQFTITLEKAFSAELENLRKEGYPEVPSKEDLDFHSSFIVLWQATRAVGMIRITPTSHSANAHDSRTVELSRGEIVPNLRGHSLYRLLVLELLLRLPDRGYVKATGIARVGSRELEHYYQFGFEAVGKPVTFSRVNDEIMAQPICIEFTKEKHTAILQQYQECRQALAAENIEVLINIF